MNPHSIRRDSRLTIIRKTADETVNNSAVLQNDDELLLPVGANQVWAFDLRIMFDGATAADIKYKFTIPAGGSGHWLRGDEISDANTSITTERNNSTAGAGDTYFQIFHCIYAGGANAGNVQFQWAQLTAGASDSKVRKDSCIIAWRLA